MRSCRLVTRSLRFYWRTHLTVVLGVAVSVAILVGALVVGDSVTHTLKTLALSRLGKVQLALATQDRYFRVALADDLKQALSTMTAPVLQKRGIAINNDGTAQANNVQVLGIDERFWALLDAGYGSARASPSQHRASSIEYHPSGGEVIINQRLATQIGVGQGDDILLRVEKISLLPRDAPMAIGEDFSIALRVTVKAVASDSVRAGLKPAPTGRFSLQASQIAPFNAFVPITWLQQKVGLSDRANMILMGDSGIRDQSLGTRDQPSGMSHQGSSLIPSDHSLIPAFDAATANSALRERWELADAGLELRELPEQGVIELRTDRVFLDPPVVSAAERAVPGAAGVLTYFVNELRHGEYTTPYSIVTAIEGTRGQGGEEARERALASSLPRPLAPPLVLSDMDDDEILINTWLAEDLHAGIGDILDLTYFVFGPMRKLEEHKSSFRVRAILPMEGIAADRELMPMLPGLSDVDNCRDWDPGVTIDLDKIRKKDEEYWDLYRGTPKAFVTLKAGQRMWGNRFGNLTALRYRIQGLGIRDQSLGIRDQSLGIRDQSLGISHQGSPLTSSDYSLISTLEAAIRSELDPASIGLFFRPVREQALAASTQAMDFGQLFLGLSIFLIIAALLLTGLLFVFGIEQRTEEVGTMLALGFRPGQVRRLLLSEGGILALMGGFLGAGIGVLYTKSILYALSTVWQGAMGVHGGISIYYHARPVTLVIGTAAGIFAALLTIWIISRGQARHSARELLSGELEPRGSGLTTAIIECRSTLPHEGRRSGLPTATVECRSTLPREGRRSGLPTATVECRSTLPREGCRNGLPTATVECRSTLPHEGCRSTLPHEGCRSTLPHGGRRSTLTRSPFARARFGLLIALVAIAAALAIIGITGTGRDVRAAGAFFGAGALLLVGCLGLSRVILSTLEQSSGILRFTIRGMGLRNSARRWGRSLAIIGLLACGSFLVIAIGANRHDPMRDAGKRSSGTGGFAFYGETTLPVLHDLNSKDGREVYGLDALEGVSFVPFRVHDGDDASCLNLNRPQNPRLLGVRPEYLRSRGAFTFAKTIGGFSNGDAWLLLEDMDGDDTVNAIADENTISWSVGKSIGDKLMYTDERGQTFYIRIAGAIANSILQGGFVISEDEFIRRFPSESGYRMFLIDAPSGNMAEVSRTLTYTLQDVGLDLTTTVGRLADFNTLQNTYLSIFQSLGGLALLLGSLGLGIVVLRNVMERRSELALLRAVGFRNRLLQRLILSEHWLLLLLGLVCGVVAGLVAVLPALRSPGADVPYISLVLTLAAILLSGVLWTWLAARLALRGPLLTALRNE